MDRMWREEMSGAFKQRGTPPSTPYMGTPPSPPYMGTPPSPPTKMQTLVLLN